MARRDKVTVSKELLSPRGKRTLFVVFSSLTKGDSSAWNASISQLCVGLHSSFLRFLVFGNLVEAEGNCPGVTPWCHPGICDEAANLAANEAKSNAT